MIEYRYGILSQLISEIDNYYQKTFAQFQKEYLQPIVTQYLVCNKSEIWP